MWKLGREFTANLKEEKKRPHTMHAHEKRVRAWGLPPVKNKSRGAAKHQKSAARHTASHTTASVATKPAREKRTVAPRL